MKTTARQTLAVAAGVGFGLVIGLLVGGQPPAAKQQGASGVISAPIPAPISTLATQSNLRVGTVTGSSGLFIPSIAFSNQATPKAPGSTTDQLQVSETILRQQLQFIRTQFNSSRKGFTRSSTNEFLYDKLLPRDAVGPRSRLNYDLIDFRASPPDLRK